MRDGNAIFTEDGIHCLISCLERSYEGWKPFRVNIQYHSTHSLERSYEGWKLRGRELSREELERYLFREVL